MRCCSVRRTDTNELASGPMNRRATKRRDGDELAGQELTYTRILHQVAEFAA